MFSKDTETNLYRLVLEATNNILEHSHAGKASVSIRRDVHCVRIVIADNGRGWGGKPGGNSAGTSQCGLGFLRMQERVNMLGGAMEISLGKGAGLKLTIQIPLPKN